MPPRAPSNRTEAFAVFVLLGASTLWGTTWLPLKYFGSHGLHGVTVTLVAYGSLGALALPWLWARRGSLRRHLSALVAIALLGGLANLSFATAVGAGDVVRVMVLFYLLPAWGVLGGRVVLGERIDARRVAGVACALFGAFLVLGGVHVVHRPPTVNDGLAVVAGLALALQNIAFRKHFAIDVWSKIAAVFVGCLVWALALCALGVGGVPVAPLEVWLWLVTFGWVWILTATIGTLWAVTRMEAGKSSILLVMELLTAVASAALLSGRRLEPLEWTGGGLIVFATLLEAWRPVPRVIAADNAPRL
jgi:drug/metabolite transporter (DMT)-like permease